MARAAMAGAVDWRRSHWIRSALTGIAAARSPSLPCQTVNAVIRSSVRHARILSLVAPLAGMGTQDGEVVTLITRAFGGFLQVGLGGRGEGGRRDGLASRVCGGWVGEVTAD